MIRQVKGKARQVNSMASKDGFNKSAEKTMTVVAKADLKQYQGHQRNQTQLLNKSI